MYSRYTSGHDEKNYQVPEHYSGCAFPPPKKEDVRRESDPIRPTPLPRTKISPQYAPPLPYSTQSPHPLPTSKGESASYPIEQRREPEEEKDLRPPKEKTKQEARLPESISQLLSHMGIGLPFSHGIDFDSLLLLGLILLLAGDGSDTELLLLLTLLLFCT